MDSPPAIPQAAARFRRHPIVFAVLYFPYGAVSGFVNVALAFLATKHGLSIQQGAVLVATSLAPQVWKFLWAPLADSTLGRTRWYLVSVVLVAVSMFFVAAVPLGPATFGLVEAVVLLSAVASTFLCFAVEAMVAHLVAPADMGRAGGWLQAGNLGGMGFGGGLGLWLLTTLPSGWETGLILAALMLACAAMLPLVPHIPADTLSDTLTGAVRHTVIELWKVMSSRDGALCALLCFLPIGTGAASAVLGQAEVAAAWGVGSTTVSLVQGFLGGIVSMAGCIAGGYGCVRLGARTGYTVYGGIMAAVTVAMALLPETPRVYIAGNLAYQFVTGLTYAAFTAFVLELIGAKLAATKYNGFASLSNTPIWYMGLLLAAAVAGMGPRGMLFAESAFGVVGILVFVAATRAWRPVVQPSFAPVI